MKYAPVSLAVLALAGLAQSSLGQTSQDYLYIYDRTAKAIKGGWAASNMQWTTILPNVEGLSGLAVDNGAKRLFFLSDQGPDKGFLVIVDVSKRKVSSKRYPMPAAYRDLSLLTYGPHGHLWMVYGNLPVDTYVHEFPSDGTNVHLFESLGRFPINGYSCISTANNATLLLSGVPLGSLQDFICNFNVDTQYSDLIAVGYGVRAGGLAYHADKVFSMENDGFLRVYESGHYPWYCVQQHSCYADHAPKAFTVGSGRLGYVLFTLGTNQSRMICLDLDFLLASNGNNYGEVRKEYITPYELNLPFLASNLIIGPPPQVTSQPEVQ